MGTSNSKLEEDKSSQLCHERKRYVKKALDGRCLLVDTHIIYLQSLRNTGRALREFFDLDGPAKSTLYVSTNEAGKPPVPKESGSSSPSLSQLAMPFVESQPKFQVNSSVSQVTDENTTSPVTRRVTDSNGPHHTMKHSAETLPWDYFNISHPVNDQQSSQERSHSVEGDTIILNAGDKRNIDEPIHNIFESQDEDEISFVHERQDCDESDIEWDETLLEGFVRSFDNINVASNTTGAASFHAKVYVRSEISEVLPDDRIRSPYLSPLVEVASSVADPVNLKLMEDIQENDIKENNVESKTSLRDLYTWMKEIDQLFIKAAESGNEVLRLLEANNMHFRRQPPQQKGEPKLSCCINACFALKEEHSEVLEDADKDNARYLMRRQTLSARLFSPMVATNSQNARDGAFANSTNDLYCMRSGSHTSTLSRLYAWEKKLYSEVKASHVVRRQYDRKCKLLGRQEARGELAKRVDKTRFVIKDLHSRIRVSIKRMESISKKISDIQDNELQPQLQELAKGYGNMWEIMQECYKLQLDIVSAELSNGTNIAINSESREQITTLLQEQLSLLSSSFANWIAAHKSYSQAIDGWLQCIICPEKPCKKIRRYQPVSVRVKHPPIFTTCQNWLEGLKKLPISDLTSSIHKLVSEISRLIPSQQKPHSDSENGKVITSNADSDNFYTSLVLFFCQLKTFSEYSVTMYKELDQSIQEAKHNSSSLTN